MLGGLDDLHTREVNISRSFFNKLSHLHPIECRRALDVGHGIGIFIPYLLIEELDTFDVIEHGLVYINESDYYLESVKQKVGQRIACGIEEFCTIGFIA